MKTVDIDLFPVDSRGRALPTAERRMLRPRVYINSFPKSGTSMATLPVVHLARPALAEYLWLGSFAGNSWTDLWLPADDIIKRIRAQQGRTFMIGHMGFRPDLEEAFIERGTCMIFVYRDLRDVAVSQTYHIESDDDDRFKHPGKHVYAELEDHDARLMAVIRGIDQFPGVVDRWRYYAFWLTRPWVLPVRYEDMLAEPQEVGERIINYVITRTLQYMGVRGDAFRADNIHAAYRASRDMLMTTEHSSTFRKGRSGEWAREFTPAHVDAFKETDAEQWLVRLGYEESDEWTIPN